jgi:quercetin 2,3-dioxygenase
MPDTGPSAPPRILVRATERGEPSGPHGHPYNPNAEMHGWMISRAAGLRRVAVNLAWIPPGKEAAIYHRHHREEEWVYFLEGRGVVEVDDVVHEVGAGDFASFPPGSAHQVRNTGSERLLLLEGGEIIPDVDVADFPRLRRQMVRFGNRVAVYPMDAELEFIPGMKEFPREMFGIADPGERARLVVRASERPAPRTFHHPQNRNAEVQLTWLSRPALKRVSAGVAVVPPGRESFVKHVHRHDEEWMYVLSGRGTAVIGDRREPIGPGDFLGFPAGGETHNTLADHGEPLVYLQGGDAWSKETIEIVDFPELGLRKTFVGTRSTLTFPLDAAVEERKG